MWAEPHGTLPMALCQHEASTGTLPNTKLCELALVKRWRNERTAFLVSLQRGFLKCASSPRIPMRDPWCLLKSQLLAHSPCTSSSVFTMPLVWRLLLCMFT